MRACILLLAVATAVAMAEKPPYSVFRSDGSPAQLDDAVAAAAAATVTFLGENHDDPTAHTLELEFLKRLHTAGPLVLALEMFERDIQYVLDEYLASTISEEHLLSSGRAWGNYKTDYRPLVEFAKENKLPVVAANAPRRYVNRVSRLGRDSLAALGAPARAHLPPLPYAEPSLRYNKKFTELMEKMQKDAAASAKPGQPERKMDIPKTLAAQSLWDASMAYAIAESLMRQPGARVLHVNGSFHSEERLGIPDHLELYRPGTRSLVITMVSHKAFPNWDAELAGKGDFIIVTDPALPRSMRSTPAPAKPAPAKPAETKPAETKPTETKPAETKATEPAKN